MSDASKRREEEMPQMPGYKRERGTSHAAFPTSAFAKSLMPEDLRVSCLHM